MNIKYFVVISAIFIYSTFAQADGRIADNTDITFISAQQLHQSLSESTVIDVRSAIEFEVLHIAGAHSVTMSNLAFVPRIKALCDAECKLVLYCNGGDCAKSEEAAGVLVKAGIKPVRVLSGGILNWIENYPQASYLLGRQPVDKSKLVSEQEFELHLLDFKQFKLKSQQKQHFVIDVRDNFQRGDIENDKGIKNSKSIPMNRLILLLDGKFGKDDTLLIYDAVGEQVKWLQYYLKDKGYQNYYFLEGGATSFPNH